MNWFQFAVQWLHVLLGVVWFGYALSTYFLIAPALARLPVDQQRSSARYMGELASRVMPVVSLLVLVLGVLRGTVFGPINAIEDLSTAYGMTFLVALVATVGLFYTGARYVGPAYAALSEEADFEAAGARLRRFAQFDLVLFFIIFTCMVLMRFGL
jgi:uncharacterized membrane protein